MEKECAKTVLMASALAGLVFCGCRVSQSETVRSLSAPVYRARAVSVSREAVTLAGGGERLPVPAFDDADFWAARSYHDRNGFERKEGALRVCASTGRQDTAWMVTSGTIRLPEKAARLTFSQTYESTQLVRDTAGTNGWSSFATWFDGKGRKISASGLPFFFARTSDSEATASVSVPADAKSVSVSIGWDVPDVRGNHSFTLRNPVLRAGSASAVAQEGSFDSEVHAAGRISWRAETPAGSAIRFQVREASDAETLAAMRFRGPDGTPNTFFTKPFETRGPLVQYRVTFASDGTASPRLLSVRCGSVEDCDWTVQTDARAPRFVVRSPSPTENRHESLVLEAFERSAVRWSTFKAVRNGADVTSAFRRRGNRLTLAAPKDGWKDGVNELSVSAEDFHGNAFESRKFFYVGRVEKVPEVTLRDDGVTLVDGRPFFPIGIYAVCKREFNDNDFDKAFRGLKEAGFNFAHTYAKTCPPDFLAAARKYGFRLWVAQRYPADDFIPAAGGNPGVIAWYLGDDTSSHESVEEVMAYHDAMKSLDPHRLTCQADPIQAHREPSRYFDYVTATDVFMPEIYPFKASNRAEDAVARTIRDMECVKKDVAAARRAGDTHPRACWPILQYFSGWDAFEFPNREQLFATSFAAIIHGAHGITWYTYGGRGKNAGITSTPERWKDMSDLCHRLQELAPVLLKRTPPQPGEPRVVSGPEKDIDGRTSVSCLLKRHGGKTYVFAVNAAAKPVKAAFDLPGVRGTAEVLWEGRTVPLADGLTDEFAPSAVHVYVFE